MAIAGKAYVWGPDETSAAAAQPPDDLGLVTQLVCIGINHYGFAAIREDGDVQTWGPVGTYEAWKVVPPGLHNVVKLIVIAPNTLGALDSSGRVWVWGSGYPGDATQLAMLLAVPTGALSGVVDIATAIGGGYLLYIVATKGDGTVVAWGSSFYAAPVLAVPSGLSGVVKVACSNTGAMALKSNGTITTWGNDFDGAVFSAAAGLTGVVDIAWDYDIGIAVHSDGSLSAFGSRGSAYDTSGITNAAAAFTGYSSAFGTTTDGFGWYLGDALYYGPQPGDVTNMVGGVIGFGHAMTIASSPPYYANYPEIDDETVTQLVYVTQGYNDDVRGAIGLSGPPPVTDFWTDTKNARFSEDAPTLLTKPSALVFHPGRLGTPEQEASITCYPPNQNQPPGKPDNGLHGCYVSFKFVNANTGATGAALVATNGAIPPQYNGPGWYVSSYTTVCYP